MMSRRRFLKCGLVATAGLALTPGGNRSPAGDASVGEAKAGCRWAFLVDAGKCVGCGFCVKACKKESEVPYDCNASRTWVERYLQTRDGTVHADSPKAARDGFTRSAIEIGAGRSHDVPEAEITKTLFVPKLCNNCDKPSCVQVCPVGATYQVPDGVVLVDRSWCIGCGYCLMACPYGVRFFHPVHRAAEKCNWCYHRICKGLKPACVEACPFGVRKIGNLLDPADPVTKVIRTERVSFIRDEYGTGPQTYYLGLDCIVR